MTPLRLPDPRETPLLRSPLSLVVCQVRHERVVAATDTRRALEVQERLAGRYPKLEERRLASVAVTLVGPAGPGRRGALIHRQPA